MPPKTDRPTRRPTPLTNRPTPRPIQIEETSTPTYGSFTYLPTSGDDAFAGLIDDAIGPDSTFNCPPASFVGCTTPNPNNPVNECPTVGQPCKDGNPGEYCCRDGCPRNYCTAKEFMGDDEFITPEPTMMDTPQPTPVSCGVFTNTLDMHRHLTRIPLHSEAYAISYFPMQPRPQLSSDSTNQHHCLGFFSS